MPRIKRPSTPAGRIPAVQALEPRLALSTVHWDGGGDGTNWLEALNWDADVLPGPADDAVIDVAAEPQVVLAGAAEVRSVQASERVLLDNGAQLNIAADSAFHADVVMDPSSTLTGTGNAVFHALLDVTSATLSGAGTSTVSPTGAFHLAGFATLARHLALEGATDWDALKATLAAGVVVTNTGEFEADSSSLLEIVSTGGVATFSQQGTFTKRGSGEMRFTTGDKLVRFDNHGPLSVEAGTLTLGGPGSHDAPVTVGAGASLRLVGNPQLDAGAAISGPGLLALGHADLDVPVDIGELRIVTGTARIMTADLAVAGAVTIDGGFLELHTDTTLRTVALVSSGIDGPADLTVTDRFTWSRGSLRGDGSTIVAPGALAEMTGGPLILARPLINRGTLDWRGGAFDDFLAHPIENLATMLIRPGGTADGPWVRNFGEVRKLGPGTADMGLPFENHGALTVEAGVLNLAGGGQSTSPITIAGGVLAISDELFALPPESPIEGAGRLEFLGAARQQVHATIAVQELFVGGFAEFHADVATPTGFSMHGGEAVFHAAADFGENQPLSFSGSLLDLGDNDLSFTTGHIAGTLATTGLLGFSGDLVWEYGEIIGAGSLRIGAASTLWMNEDFRHVLGVNLESDGRIVWSYRELELLGVTLDSRGVIELQVPGVLSTTGSGSVINRGLLIKTGEGGAILGRRFDEVAFENLGEVRVQEGVLFAVETPNFDDAAGNLSGGIWRVYAFAELNFADEPIRSIGPDTILSMTGRSSAVAGIEALQHVAGALELLSRAQITTTPAGGVLTQSGTIRLGIGAKLAVTGSLVQSGSAHTIVQVESTHPLEGFGRLVATGVELDGALTVLAVAGYTPGEGASHHFIQATGAAGQFDTLALPDPAPGDKWAVRYDANGVTLLHTDFADMDLNGVVDTRDFLVYLNLFVAEDPQADANGDGTVDTLDFLYWLNAWGDG
ncbi:MAG TPA: GC-type dockerin domain-anchored protein [Phycisphaerales bacterium]|nr:GC-type dockerin domain-anchored protein [Phycisphaerales bacterium]